MIGIFTHTRGESPWMEECMKSVRQALTPDSEHLVQRMSGNYQEERFSALRSYEYVGFVDDDDIIERDSIAMCIDALEQSGAGVAYTYQRQIDEAGNDLGMTIPARTYFDVAMHPMPLHHFALMRRSAVDDEAIRAAREHDTGIDWLMKANAALRHGAIQVPIVGYRWRIHPGQDSRESHEKFSRAIPTLRRTTQSWVSQVTKIPVYEVGNA